MSKRMQRNSFVHLATCAVLIVGISLPAFAQSGPRPQPLVSIDVRVLNADRVAVGRITEVVRKQTDAALPVGARGEADISISVEETLKGGTGNPIRQHIDGGQLSLTTAASEMSRKKSPVLVIGKVF